MAPHDGELLSDDDFRQATDEQLFSLVTKLDLVLQSRKMSGIEWRAPHELEPSDPADPSL
jgi:hypothetical protein